MQLREGGNFGGEATFAAVSLVMPLNTVSSNYDLELCPIGELSFQMLGFTANVFLPILGEIHLRKLRKSEYMHAKSLGFVFV